MTAVRQLASMRAEVDALRAQVATLERYEEDLRLVTAAMDEALQCDTVDEIRELLCRTLHSVYPEAEICLHEVDDDGMHRRAAAAVCDSCPDTLSPDTCVALARNTAHLSADDAGPPSCPHAPRLHRSVCVPLAANGIEHGVIRVALPAEAPSEQHQLLLLRTRSVAQRFSIAMTAAVQRAALHERAHTDGLTGLMNRTAFVDELTRLIAAGQRHPRAWSLALVDLDLFKELNDTHGHAAGDEMLRAVARCLRAHVREGDFCARFGGDEFAIALPDADADEARITAERIREAIAELRVAGTCVCASIGIVGTDGGEAAPSSADDAYRLADAALYTAKRAGGHAVVVDART